MQAPLTDSILEILERIREAGGVAFVARNCSDVLRELTSHERTL